MRLFAEVLAPAIISIDNPRFLAFIPAAPTELSMMFDLVVGASSIYAGTWMEASGAVYAENQALDWLAGLAGLPETAAGCFVQGGTIGNLSALVAARHAHRAANGGRRGAPLARRMHRRDALVRRHGSGRDGRRPPSRRAGRTRPDDGRGPGGRDRAGGRRRALRGSRHRRHDEPRRDRRPGRHRRRVQRPRRLDARRRGLRRSGARGAVRPRPLRRDRARRLVHRRSAQVALRPVRLVRAALPAARAGPSRAHAARRLPRGGAGQRAKPVRLRGAPQPEGARPAVLVLARRARHTGLRRRPSSTPWTSRARPPTRSAAAPGSSS